MALRPTVFVVLLFPDSRPESRWLHEAPRIGTLVYDTRGRGWRVTEVLQCGAALYTVVCEAPSHGIAGVHDLAADLLDRARKAISPTERRRKRHVS